MPSSSYSETRKRIQAAHHALENHETITDGQLIEVVEQFFVMTNTLSAAELLMWAVAPICSRRKHLTERLFPKVLRPLWMTAFRTDRVIAWINAHLQGEKPFDLDDAVALDWIRAITLERDLIDRLLIDVEEEENYSETQKLRAKLAPYSHVPVERIKFRYYWADYILDRSNLAVVFLYEDNEQSRQAFDLLTKVISGVGSSNLTLFVTDYYFEFLESYQTFSDLPDLDQNPIQVAWFFRGKPVSHLRLSDLDENKIRDYTLHLISQSDK